MNDDLRMPATLTEAIRLFSDPGTALKYAVALRWPDGVSCPRCGHDKAYFLKTQSRWKCADCRKQFSVKVGTIMEDSPLGLDAWLTAIWFQANSKNGISSHELARHLGITQKSAWFMLHRIRHAQMVGSFEKLSGEVEVDETFIGPKAGRMNRKARIRNKAKRPGTRGKTVAVTAVERGGKVRSTTTKNTSRHELHKAVKDAVEPGTTLYTDENASYDRLDDYDRKAVNHSRSQYVDGNTHTQNVENYHSLLKRCVRGTWVCPSPEHMNAYLGEQAFRYGERTDNDGGRFVKAASSLDGRLTYQQLTAHGAGRGPRRGFDWRRGF